VSELERAVADVRALAPGERVGVAAYSHRAAGRRIVRRFVPRPARAAARRLLTGLPRTRTWSSPSVAREHAELVRHQLAHPENVAPFRTFLAAAGALAEDFDLPHPARLLDFGCGAGHYAELLDRYLPGRFEYTGCDGSAEMVEAARRERPGKTFHVNDLFSNALDLDSFDVLVASALIDVVADYERALDVLLGNRARTVLLHRQRITDGPSRVDSATGYTGQSTVATYLNLDDLRGIAARTGRTVARTFPVENEMHSFILPLVSET
jgi:SAM-dependent methyltransferase